jgi:hypothetical protein
LEGESDADSLGGSVFQEHVDYRNKLQNLSKETYDLNDPEAVAAVKDKEIKQLKNKLAQIQLA